MDVEKDLPIADLILTNANIITLDPLRPKANWMRIRNGKVLSLGDKGNVGKLTIGKSRIIDCRGKTVLPGFIDAHIHLPSFAESLVIMNLGPSNDIRSISDIQSRIRTFCRDLPSGRWIRGQEYNEFYLAEKRHPTRWDLDQAAPDHPIKLTHRSGHAHVLNSRALELVGISKETPDPPGGIIDRHLETGEPTGLLFEMHTFLSKRIPSLDTQQLERGVMIMNRELLSLGITSVQDATALNDRERWKMVHSWKQRGLLKSRVNMMLGIGGFEHVGIHNFSNQEGHDQLRLSGVKIIVDETTGQLHPPQSELNRMVLKVHGSGLQVAIHAIEEKAIESACSAIEYALGRRSRSNHRHRIEHCSVCPPSLAKRMASLGIMVVTQPAFIYYNGDRYLETVPGEQLQHLYPIRILTKSGIQVAGSSDCPIVPPNPLIGIYAAISRMSERGEIVSAKEGIVPMEAVRMYTNYAARANFEEKIKGSIAPRKLADLVVLNGDPTRIPPDEIKDLKVKMTILNGEVVWDASG